MTQKPQPKVLISTLGTETQVVTLDLWALGNQLPPPVYPAEVGVIHTSERAPAIQESLERLQVPYRVLLKTFHIASLRGKSFQTLRISRQ